MDYPEYVIIDNEEYKINTNFKVAIECNQIAEDDTIGDYERSLAIIYKLFGEKGLNATNHYEQLMHYAEKYFLCGREEPKNDKNKKPDMDFIQDYRLIWTSIYSEYQRLDIDKEEIHLWKFMDLLEGLSNSELGNCCILNRVRNYRNIDPRKIKDPKERQQVIDIQKEIALKKNEEKKKPTRKQRESANELYKRLGLRRE